MSKSFVSMVHLNIGALWIARAIGFLFTLVGCDSSDQYKQLDNNLPSTVPKIFAPEIISKQNRFEQYCTFSQDGKELYFSITDKDWNYLGMYYSRFENNAWSEPDTAFFTEKNLDGGEPFIHDNTIYFVSVRHNGDPWHTDIYEVDRGGTSAETAQRVKGGVNSPDNEWHPTLTSDGTMYFGSERGNKRFLADIYKAEQTNGQYTNAIKLPGEINTAYNDCDPLISPDESFLIFHSDRPGGYGEHDLYISFKTEEDTWSTPKNMGKEINSPEWELGPSLSADGKFLFFTRRKSFQTETPSKIYWVSTTVLEALR